MPRSRVEVNQAIGNASVTFYMPGGRRELEAHAGTISPDGAA